MTAVVNDAPQAQEWARDDPAPQNLDATLSERGSRYGIFASHAKITQDLKSIMRRTPGWERLRDSQKEALEMNAHKIGRILNGDPDYDDSWVDIAGYAQLVVKELNGTLV